MWVTGTEGLVRGRKAVDTGNPIMIPVGPGTLGRIMNVTGDPIDERGPIEHKLKKRTLPKFYRITRGLISLS